MGSPVSVVVANLVMKDIEWKALSTFHTPPRFWRRYVDDTRAALPMNLVDSFHDHLNSIDPDIQFAVEKKSGGQLPPDPWWGRLHQHLGLPQAHPHRPVLGFQSHHPAAHKRAVIWTLMHQAEACWTELCHPLFPCFLWLFVYLHSFSASVRYSLYLFIYFLVLQVSCYFPCLLYMHASCDCLIVCLPVCIYTSLPESVNNSLRKPAVGCQNIWSSCVIWLPFPRVVQYAWILLHWNIILTSSNILCNNLLPIMRWEAFTALGLIAGTTEVLNSLNCVQLQCWHYRP